MSRPGAGENPSTGRTQHSPPETDLWALHKIIVTYLPGTLGSTIDVFANKPPSGIPLGKQVWLWWPLLPAAQSTPGLASVEPQGESGSSQHVLGVQ